MSFGAPPVFKDSKYNVRYQSGQFSGGRLYGGCSSSEHLCAGDMGSPGKAQDFCKTTSPVGQSFGRERRDVSLKNLKEPPPYKKPPATRDYSQSPARPATDRLSVTAPARIHSEDAPKEGDTSPGTGGGVSGDEGGGSTGDTEGSPVEEDSPTSPPRRPSNGPSQASAPLL